MQNSRICRLVELIDRADFVLVNGQLVMHVLSSPNKKASDLYLVTKNNTFGVDGDIQILFSDHQPVQVAGFCGLRVLPQNLTFEFHVRRKLRLTDLE